MKNSTTTGQPGKTGILNPPIMMPLKLIQGQPFTEAMNLRTTEGLMDHVITRAGELNISRNEFLNRLIKEDKEREHDSKKKTA